MKNFSNEEFDCHFIDEGFMAKDIMDQKINEISPSDDNDAFHVVDLGDFLKKHLKWLKTLPWVTSFYTVKCKNSGTMKTLAAIGMGFHCANNTEIQLVQFLQYLQRGLSMQVLVNNYLRLNILSIMESR